MQQGTCPQGFHGPGQARPGRRLPRVARYRERKRELDREHGGQFRFSRRPPASSDPESPPCLQGGPSPPCPPARPRGCYPDEPRPASPGPLTARAPEPESASRRPGPLRHARRSPLASTSRASRAPRSPRPREVPEGAVPSRQSSAPRAAAGARVPPSRAPALCSRDVGALGERLLRSDITFTRSPRKTPLGTDSHRPHVGRETAGHGGRGHPARRRQAPGRLGPSRALRASLEPRRAVTLTTSGRRGRARRSRPAPRGAGSE